MGCALAHTGESALASRYEVGRAAGELLCKFSNQGLPLKGLLRTKFSVLANQAHSRREKSAIVENVVPQHL